MYERLIQINPDSKHSVFIFGARGTGKTSWLKKSFPDAIYIDLLDDDTYTELLGKPSRLEAKIPSHHTDWVIIDEIQKIPPLLNEVHRLIEAKKLRFILTGSSARKLRRKGVNLLAGRALTYHMYPLTAMELQGDDDIEHAIQYGRLPSVIQHESPAKYLSSYVKTYLREEVYQESLVRNLQVFTRFMEVTSFSQGETINYTEIAREVGSNRNTVTTFFDILEDLLIAYRIPVFTKRAKRKLTSHSKFYYFDAGVYRSIRPSGPLDLSEEITGPLLETLFLQEVKALIDYFDLKYTIYYWRTQSQIEVDFVLYGASGFHAFEIKRKEKLTKKDFKGLSTFGKDYPMATRHMLYGGSKSYYENDVHVYPFKEALQNIKDLLTKSTRHRDKGSSLDITVSKL